MKNIHLLPTDKPSRLYKHNELGFKLLAPVEHEIGAYNGSNQHIYTTSDEEIKEGDWIYYTSALGFCKTTISSKGLEQEGLPAKKIILTTDQDLINDGVQAIDDEFLEWFVKNSSCEWVEVIYDKDAFPYGVETAKGYGWYKITIPQEGTFINP